VPIFASLQTGQLTYASLTTQYPTYNDMNFMYGDLRSRAIDQTGGIRTVDHALYIYNGLPGEASLTTHDFGDRESLFQVTSIKPQYSIYPESGATIQPLNQKRRVGTPVPGAVRSLRSNGRFDVENTALLQRYKHTSLSECEIVGCEAMIEYAGEA
jgi:hypothetical protein